MPRLVWRRTRMGSKAKVVAGIVGLAAVAVPCVAPLSGAAKSPATPPRPALKRFGSCGSLVRYAHHHAVQTLSPALIGPISPLVRQPYRGAPILGNGAPAPQEEGKDF